MEVYNNGSEKTFILPASIRSMLAYVLDNSNPNILSNLLGTFYIDQESGWVVFNRGTVVNGQSFNVDQLIYGLSNIDERLFIKYHELEKKINTYKDILNLSNQSQNNLLQYSEQSISVSDEIAGLQQELDCLKIDLKEHNARKRSIIAAINHNEEILDYIDKMQLYIEQNHEKIRVSKDNLYPFEDSKDMLDEQLNYEKIQIADLNANINKIQKELIDYFSTGEIIWNSKIMGAKPGYKIDSTQSKINLGIFEKQLEAVKEPIAKEISKQEYKNKMDNTLKDYCSKLDVLDILDETNLILCRNFKRNTGTKKQKLVLAYRLTCLKTISEYLGVKFPIIIDSFNRETDSKNMESMYKFITTEFADHQIIISTISRSPFTESSGLNTITISDRLLKTKDKKVKKFT